MENTIIQFGSGGYFTPTIISVAVPLVLFFPFLLIKLFKKSIAGTAPLWLFIGLGLVLPAFMAASGCYVAYSNRMDFDTAEPRGDVFVLRHSLASEPIEVNRKDIRRIGIVREFRGTWLHSWTGYLVTIELTDGKVLFSEETSYLPGVKADARQMGMKNKTDLTIRMSPSPAGP